MKRYKVVVSDLHLGRGRVLNDGSLNILEDFLADRQFVEFLEFYSSGIYYDSEVELILNGDILDTLAVDYRGYYSPIITESISVEKIRSILKGHPKFVEGLRAFAQTPNHKISYIVGNHDIDFIWESAKEVFSEAIGAPIQFKNFTYTVDGVHYEHGHQFEAVNRINPKMIFINKGLKEPIINLPWGSHFVVNFVIPIKMEQPAIDKVRPINALIRWSMLTNFKWFVKTGIRATMYFFATRFSKSLYRTTNLVTTIKILKEISKTPQLANAARKVMDQNQDVHTVIMGHTHGAKYVQFADGKEYLNSGTWTEVTNLDLLNFGKATRYNYIFIDYTKNPMRPRAYLKEWRGRWHEDLDVYTG